jgi:hypothetical protein
MNESEKIREYFQNTQSRLTEDRPHDHVELASNVETLIVSNSVFHLAVVTVGANEVSILVNVTLVESKVADKYKSRSEWGSKSDANRFLSGVMANTTVNRPVLERVLEWKQCTQ